RLALARTGGSAPHAWDERSGRHDSTRRRWAIAPPDHARWAHARRDHGTAGSRAVLRATARRAAGARPESVRTHGRESVLRAEHAHARVVRDRRPAPRRGSREPRHADLLARQGRNRARYDLHVASDA